MKWKSFMGALLLAVAAAACQKTETTDLGASPEAATPAESATTPASNTTTESVTTTDAVVDPDVAKLAVEEPIAVSITDSGIEVTGSPVPGATRFQVTNNGTQQHSLVIEGPGGKAQLSAPLAPLEVGTVTLNVAPGTYRLYCPMEPDRLTAQLEVAPPAS